jgi:outer membrane protein TolC
MMFCRPGGGFLVHFFKCCLCVVSLFSLAVRGSGEEVLGSTQEKWPLAEILFPELEGVLRQAVSQSPQMVDQNLKLAIEEANSIVSSAKMYPRASAYVRELYQIEDRRDIGKTTEAEKFYYDLSLYQPIYHWGALKASSDMGKIRVELEKGKVKNAYQSLVQKLRSDYINLVITKLALRNAELALSRREADLELKKASLEEGEASKGSVGGAEITLKEARFNHVRSESEFGYSLRSFQRLSGIDEFTIDRVADGFPDVIYHDSIIRNEVEEFGTKGRESHSKMEAATMEIEKEELNFRIHKVRMRPKLSLIAGINQDELSSATSTNNRTATQRTYIGVQVSWNIFDGFETKGRKLASMKRLRQLRESKKRLEEDLLIGAEHRADRVDFAAQAVRFAFDKLRRAKGRKKYVESEYGKGRASEGQVNEIKGNLNNYELALAKIQRDYLNTLADFVSWIGEDPAMDNFRYVKE